PAVIYADIAAGYLGEWNGGRESEPGVSFMRGQILVAPNLDNVAVVIPASNFEMRSANNIHLQLRYELRRGFDTGVNQQAVLVWIAKNRSVNPVTTVVLVVGNLKSERRFG